MNPKTVIMDSDKAVTAVSQCGGWALAPFVPMALVVLGLLVVIKCRG